MEQYNNGDIFSFTMNNPDAGQFELDTKAAGEIKIINSDGLKVVSTPEDVTHKNNLNKKLTKIGCRVEVMSTTDLDKGSLEYLAAAKKSSNLTTFTMVTMAGYARTGRGYQIEDTDFSQQSGELPLIFLLDKFEKA